MKTLFGDELYTWLKDRGVKEPYCISELPEPWWDLVDQLIKDLLAAGWLGQLGQVKEKFNGLRFYIDLTENSDEDYKLLEPIISKAEAKSFALYKDFKRKS